MENGDAVCVRIGSLFSCSARARTACVFRQTSSGRSLGDDAGQAFLFSRNRTEHLLVGARERRHAGNRECLSDIVKTDSGLRERGEGRLRFG